MDTQTITSYAYDWHSLPPALLFAGNRHDVAEHATSLMQSLWCTAKKNAACARCSACTRIAQRQWHGLTWVSPQKGYTLDDLDGVTRAISFALDPDEHHFFVLENADALSPACANSLLKSVEEPPAGYHFIFLCERPDGILPTIRSRSTLIRLAHATVSCSQLEILSYFQECGNYEGYAHFVRALETAAVTERECADIVDALINAWSERYKEAIVQHNEELAAQARHALALLRTSLSHQLMPGSAKLFLKNLFLQFHA